MVLIPSPYKCEASLQQISEGKPEESNGIHHFPAHSGGRDLGHGFPKPRTTCTLLWDTCRVRMWTTTPNLETWNRIGIVHLSLLWDRPQEGCIGLWVLNTNLLSLKYSRNPRGESKVKANYISNPREFSRNKTRGLMWWGHVENSESLTEVWCGVTENNGRYKMRPPVASF